IVSGPPQGLLTVAILGSLWTASSAVEGMRTVLNRAYQVSEPPKFYWRRLMSILQIVLLTGVVIVVRSGLVIAPIALTAIAKHTGISIPLWIQEFFDKDFIFVGAGLLFFAIASLYYWLPNIKQSLWAVVPGAALVVLLWLAGAALVTFYLDNISQLNIIYG